ncbi:hypothetical protein JAAARDRAFT_208172 [Jaapia argillacea MUCL 33604]|uniref:C2 domain-containing protein n=1 Tax=Jaapia argillacea MUCL 33604 TaxID=933084 RepID=A0A067PQ26_9AGAM|nr:hypothetical protein JAAARDRAFT_208172 [Jaapia argillacea MUCL 33604]
MSRRSVDSAAHDKRVSKHRVTDDDLFNYALRVALLAYLIQPKPVGATPAGNGDTKDKDYTSRLSGALSSSILSLGDLFKDVREGPKSVKFPEKLLKVLEQKLQDIAMGKDAAYSDQLVRRTMAVFYGQFTNDSFKRQMKENRKIEELILMFATHATNVLKKEPTLAGDGWKLELNNQISLFVRMLRDCLKNVNHVSPELTARLDMYIAKLAPTPAPAPSDSGYDSSSTSRDSVSSPIGVSGNIMDMPLVKTVAKLFKIPDATVQKEVDQLRRFCTEKAALQDLKTCLKNINAGATFPGRREDFDSDAAWQHWKHLETSQLSQLMLVMVQFNPELAKSTPSEALPSAYNPSQRPTSVYSFNRNDSQHLASRTGSVSSRRSIIGLRTETIGEEGDDEDDNFTFIPPNAKKFYKRLLEACITADLKAMLSDEVQDDDEVSLGILSPPHIELINECAVRWRIGQPYRVASFLDLVKQFYERNDVPLECVPEALQAVTKVTHEITVDKWPVPDVEYLATVYGGLFSIFLASLYHTLDKIPALKRDDIAPYLAVLEVVHKSGLLERFGNDITARFTDVKDKVKQVAAHFYEQKVGELRAQPGVNRALPLLFITDEIEKSAKLLDKRFPEPILGRLDLVSLVVGVLVPHFVADLEAIRKQLFEDSMNGATPDVPIEDVFALYRRTKTILEMHGAFCEGEHIDFDLGSYFEPYVRQWLVNTDNKTAQWVQNAIAADKFQAESSSGHSSSIVDLFDSLRSPITFLQDLEWSDDYQQARFFTNLSKTISKAVEQYCRSVEDLFMTEMFPRPTDFLQPQKSSAWLEKAKQLAAGEKKVEPFNFQPESCVKLNNVEAARKLLDNMYSQIQADKVAEVLEQHGPAVPEKQERQRFLFTVKIAVAEGLVPLDSNPSSKLDTFVTLSDEAGNRLAKTRTIYETLTPRWDETFDLSVDKPLWLMVSIRDRALVGKHDTVGRAYICLDSRRFGDFLNHDLWLDLDTTGRILLRISMEGERDDILFYFGRAFRSLKRAEGDMVRIFIDKMSPFIQQCLSQTTLRTLTSKNGAYSLDYNKALGGVTALYRSALGTPTAEVQIPLPEGEKPRFRPEQMTDMELEQALSPLFDYLDANLQTFNTYLSDDAKGMVMSRVWKEVLAVIEGLLIPPLSDVPSDMKPLSDKEVDIVFKWLKFLLNFFNAEGEGPVPLESLQNQKYRDVVSIRLYYDWHTDLLMEECVRMMQQSFRSSPSVKKRAKSVYAQRNLGTIKDRKREKQQEKEKEITNGETIMRILRMRPGTSDFIAQQLQIMTQMQAEQEARVQQSERRKIQRPKQGQQPPVPPLPSVPES